MLLTGAVSACLVTVAVATPSQYDDEPACGGPCDADPDCALAVASCHVEREGYRQALEELKVAYEAHSDDGRLVRMMALAYLGLGNSAWAVKRLLGHLDDQPDDPETRAWAVWLLIQEGDPVRAATLLGDAPAVAPGPAKERMTLLSAAIEDLQENRDDAEASLREVMGQRGPIYPEDRVLLDHLRARVRAETVEPLSVRVQLSGGYTSNAIQSSPTDPGAEVSASETTGSPLLAADAVVRFEPWTSRWLRPSVELRGKTQGQLSTAAMDYSYASLGGRVGLDVGDRGPHLLVVYNVELLAIHGGDAYHEHGPRWFTEAHRAEVEFLPIPQVQVFTGVGRRIYRELPRTRTELDGGVAMVLDLPRGWNLTAIATGRYHDARHDAYDGFGVTGLLRLAMPLPQQAMIKVKGMVVGDRYPDSASFFLSDDPRGDLLGKVQVGPWSPPLGGFRLGLTYTFSDRRSTVENYTYRDHRVLLELRWGEAWDPMGPSTIKTSEDHLSLPYGLERNDDSGLDRVQDLLRQEDSARRGSSCVD
jgi:hypothetical protein